MKNYHLFYTAIVGAALAGCGHPEKKAAPAPEPVKVETLTAGYAPMSSSEKYSGVIEAESGTSLSFSSIGTVKAVYVAEGQFVRKGQLVAEVDDASLQSAYAAAKAALDQAEDAYGRLKGLHERGSLPEIKWVEVQTQLQLASSSEAIARKALSDARLYAPVSGYVFRKSIEAGQNVAPGIPIMQLVKLDPVKVAISVPESEISSFSDGMTLHIAVPALGGGRYSGQVVERGVSADLLSRTYQVKARIANPERKLLSGMLCEVWTERSEGEQAILLPAQIIQIDSGNGHFVWTVQGGEAVKTPVRTDGYAGENVRIAEGLHAGDKVIVKGQQKVSTGMKIREQ